MKVLNGAWVDLGAARAAQKPGYMCCRGVSSCAGQRLHRRIEGTQALGIERLGPARSSAEACPCFFIDSLSELPVGAFNAACYNDARSTLSSTCIDDGGEGKIVGRNDYPNAKKEKKMKKLCVTVLGLLAFGVSAAWAQDVSYNFAKDAKFSDYKTYKWVDLKGADEPNQITQNQIKAAIDAELGTKGLTKTDSDDADLYVGMQTAIGTEKQFTSFSSGWGGGPGWGGGWYGGGGMNTSTTTGSTSTIYIGQLGVDMYDSKNKDLVWRGRASKTINPKAKPDKQEKNIKKAVAKLLKNYPPKQS
jgi:hypothetical protein